MEGPALKKVLPAVLLSALWISMSEFLRNEFALKSHWIAHYRSLGLEFPSAPVNGMVWGIWSICFAILIVLIGRRSSFPMTAIIAWIAGFPLMWLVLGNLLVLPYDILFIAVPWSMVEVIGASFIVHKVAGFHGNK